MIKASFKYSLLAIVVLFLSLFIFISTTTLGARFVFNIASHIISGKLNIQSISGAFNRTITIKAINYSNNSLIISANNVQLHLQPLALLLNELRINSLNIKQLIIEHLKSPPSSTTPKTPQFFLPIKLRLANVHLQNLRLIKAKQIYPVKDVNLSGFIQSNTITINHLQANYQQRDYHMAGKIALQPINVNLQLQVSQQQTTQLAMQINGYGDWKNLVIKTNVTIPASLRATLTLHDVFDNLSWQLTGNLQNFSTQRYTAMVAYPHISGNFNGSGTAQQANFSANIMPDPGAAKSHIKLQLSSKDLKTQQFTGQLSWQNLSLPNLTRQNATSSQGKIQLQGTLNHYRISSNLNFSGRKVPTGNLQLSGDGDLKQINIHTLKVAMLNGDILGQAHLKWSPTLDYQAQFTAQHLQPQQKWIDWPGNISFTVKATGTAKQNEIELNNLQGSLREQSLTGSANLQLHDHHIERAVSHLRLGKAKVDINLKRTDYLQSIWDIEIPDLAKATPFGNGELNTRGQLKTTHALPMISGYITGKNLAWLDYQIGTLKSQFTFNLNSTQPSQVQLTATALKLFNYHFTKLTFTGSGNQKQQRLNLSIAANNENLTAKALSQYQNKQWQFNFSQFSLTSTKQPTWQLKNPFTLNYADNLLVLKNFAWQVNNQTINANFSWQNKTLKQAKFNLHQVALNLFNLFLPNNIHLQGKINANAQYDWQKNDNSHGNIQTTIEQAKIQYMMYGQKQSFSIQHGDLQAELKKQQLNAKLKLQLLSADYLTLNLTADPFKLTNNFIHTQISQGTLTAHLTQLNFLSLIFPQLESIKGIANVHLAWHGTLTKPHLTGSANLTQASATLPAQGLQLKNIRLQAAAANNKVDYQLQVLSGKGTLTANGSSYLNDDYKTSLTLSGNDITVIDTPQYQITASPKLKLVVNDKRIDLTGDIMLPNVYIDLTNYANVVRLPSEVIITDTKQNNNQTSILEKFHARLKLILGKNIRFKNDHLDVQLAGALVLIDNPRTTTRANGELTIIKGTFTIFGQTLNIENGKLIYVGGPTTNPGLDIKATKTIHTFVSPTQNSLTQTGLSPTHTSPSQQVNIPLQQKTIVVGVSVTNTLDNPHITLFSDEPGLSQTDILSYLILGYPTDNASNQQAQALLRALNALNANNNNTAGMIDRIKQTLSLDQIGLQSDTYLNSKTNTVAQNTSLVLGKMLSPKLFVRYSIGLIEPINTLSTAYQFNQHWTVQTQSNSLGNGIDLTYSWEQN